MEEKEILDQREGAKERMNPDEVAALLSQTMRDLTEKKTTVRHALAVSRVAMALAKVIEVVDLKDRVELLERIMETRKKK